MTPVITGPPPLSRTAPLFPWATISWVSLLLVVCYEPLLKGLLAQWYNDPDMGHGFFVPVIAGYIAWLQRDRIAGKIPRPNWWGLAIVLWAAFQLY
ncbi:MAG: exosortase/archaeosortase family protein, partial [Acidobacteriota bacterium]|nr:exosortase/archaeosortase family protein [Acidobacteriota bacterium]